MLTIEPPRAGDIDELEAKLCREDRDELQAAGHATVRDGIGAVSMLSLRWRGQLLALLGCAPLYVDDNDFGVPWMLSTEAIEVAPRVAVARACRSLVDGWRAEYRRLQNLVHSSNHRAVALVVWLGFTVHREPAGPGGAFWKFEWEASDV